MKAVILAGGKGTRLAPYTVVFPKPMMPLNDTPILDIVIRQLKFYGFDEIIMAVGHLAELLQAYFNDGSRYGVKIQYSREEKPLGTAGPMALIDDLNDTFLMMNGDILTLLDYSELVRYHQEMNAIATIATYEREAKIDLGVVETDGGNRIVDYIEKPRYHFQVSMGIYVFEPEVLNYVNKNERLDFPDLVKTLLRDEKRVLAYPYDGYWLDIGRPDDYAKAAQEFEKYRTQFLKEE